MPGNSKSLWTAVKKAKNVNINSLPENLTLNSIKINNNDLPDTFAEFFTTKVKNITAECKIDRMSTTGKIKSTGFWKIS